AISAQLPFLTKNSKLKTKNSSHPEQAGQDFARCYQVAVYAVQGLNPGRPLVYSLDLSRHLSHVQLRDEHGPDSPQNRFNGLSRKRPERNELYKSCLHPSLASLSY